MTVAEALSQFRTEHGLPPDGGESKRWAKMKFGPIVFPMPNTKGRKRALFYHDIHHVITGYKGVFRDETRIGAWEVASGCAHYYVAWMYNLWAMALGLLLYPHSTYRAFIRGRHSSNLYGTGRGADELLNRETGHLAEELLPLGTQPRARPRDLPAFAFWSVAALVTLLLPPAVVVGGVWLVVRVVV